MKRRSEMCCLFHVCSCAIRKGYTYIINEGNNYSTRKYTTKYLMNGELKLLSTTLTKMIVMIKI